MNEALPTSIGAALIIMAGIVTLADTVEILNIISGAAITIIATIIMSLVLDSIGFFRWTAVNIIKKANGSGVLLYWYICLLCFLMTLFFNNDGSILITTPIIIQIVTILNLKPHQKMPYLFAGVLVATTSSSPIAVSNLANLIALRIVGLDINAYVALMFVPTIIGITVLTLLLYLFFKKDIPKKILALPDSDHISIQLNSMYGMDHSKKHNTLVVDKFHHPLKKDPNYLPEINWSLFRICITIVIFTRASFFLGSSFGIPLEWIAMFGAFLLILVRWYRNGTGAIDVLKKTPWYILIFAFSIYVIVHALHKIGLTFVLVTYFEGLISMSHFHAIFVTGILVAILSNIFNNIPAVMIGTLSLMEMGLDTHTMHLAYLANIIGSDIGALISPMGTLATLLWIYILRLNKIPITWGKYFRVAICVIPLSLLVCLLGLYLWSRLFI
ncbi:arsenical pump membrane protein [Caldalkalibacillus uzonensis]|uniref:Arsenical pump membrane protein n=2 Tax=Caldalkalibacillus uzonensis TaxID=353224 RepID=A0ABU0CX48_9BACI|nr:arsenical pump membrane protein [Caldalkalibacillus uzonensis]